MPLIANGFTPDTSDTIRLRFESYLARLYPAGDGRRGVACGCDARRGRRARRHGVGRRARTALRDARRRHARRQRLLLRRAHAWHEHGRLLRRQLCGRPQQRRLPHPSAIPGRDRHRLFQRRQGHVFARDDGARARPRARPASTRRARPTTRTRPSRMRAAASACSGTTARACSIQPNTRT